MFQEVIVGRGVYESLTSRELVEARDLHSHNMRFSSRAVDRDFQLASIHMFAAWGDFSYLEIPIRRS